MCDNDWDTNVIDFLDSIRRKCSKLSNKHTSYFFYYNRISNLFDVPIIILSTLSASFAVGTTAYLDQPLISLINCIVSMVVAILSSIKLYLNIVTNKNNELDLSKAFYILSLNIQKVLHLPKELRKVEQLDFLNATYDSYIVLIQKSSLIKANEESEKMDKLLEKIKSSPRLTLRQPLKNPLIKEDEEFGFTIE